MLWWAVQVPETLGEEPATTEHTGFHRADRHTEDLGGHLEREPFEIDKHHGAAELGLDPLERLLDIGPQLCCCKVISSLNVCVATG